jgi:nitrate/TMAO reductase-like tetraheme cytochrome c subunit
MQHRKALLLILIISFILVLGVWSVLAPTAPAAPLLQDTPTPAPTEPETVPTRTPIPNLSIGNEYCLSCHGQPGQTFTLGNGDVLDLYVPPELHQNSVHGEEGIACVQCHADVGEYPHPEWQAADRRDATLKLNAVCQRCHNSQYQLNQDGVHVSVRASGNTAGATCSDCHTAHEIPRLNDPKTHELLPEAKKWIPERCGLCHNAIYQKYKESVHGSALTEGNTDVPTCIDCHGVHNIEDPRTAAFRLKSPEMCGKCHADKALMQKYGISTDVFDTYVADFHGTTVEIFEKESPNAEVNKAVCYDCHGIHDIGRTDDPHVGLQMQENLLKTCQTCHPDASTNFTAAWMSHYIPSPEKYPVVYYVNIFYLILIPITLGGMAVLVVMDVSRTSINRWGKRKKRFTAQAQAEAVEEQEVEASVVDVPLDQTELTEAPENQEPAGENPSSNVAETPPPPDTPNTDAEAQNG